MKRLLLIVLLCVGTSAFAQPSGDITVQSVWARATPPGAKTAAVYLTLLNKGPDDQLIGATTPVAVTAGLHTEITDNGVMKMRPLASVDIAANGKAVLEPSGKHIMLTGLKHPLKQGQHFPMTLRFLHAPSLTVQVEVAKVGAAGPNRDDMHDMEGM